MISQKDILKPVVFLDIFDYPLTAMEVWRFLGVEAELGETVGVLSQECHTGPVSCHGVNSGRYPVFNAGAGQMDPGLSRDDTKKERFLLGMTKKNGFYFLSGREGLIEKRREFFALSEKKRRVAKKAAQLLKFIPGVKMAAICNNFYYHAESDIDFFIVAEKNRLWTVRFWATILLDLFCLRARGKKRTDRICLSFYATADCNLEKVALFGGDPYLYYWLAFLEPVYDNGGGDNFWQSNAWIKKHFPNFYPNSGNKSRMVKDGFLSLAIKRFFNIFASTWLGDFLEIFFKSLQFKKVAHRFSGPGVVISEEMIKLHENDRRELFREEFEKKNKEIIGC
jgi:hypothetical protein